MGERSKGAFWAEAYLDAMKGVMSNSRGKETYVVIFRRSLAECSNRWGMARAGGEGVERGGEGAEKWKNRGRKTGEGRERERERI